MDDKSTKRPPYTSETTNSDKRMKRLISYAIAEESEKCDSVPEPDAAENAKETQIYPTVYLERSKHCCERCYQDIEP